MVFWKTYPIEQFIKIKCNFNVFKSLIFNKIPIISPTGIESSIITSCDTSVVTEIQQFLRKYFGNPPKTPIFDIPMSQLLGEDDHIIYLRDIDKNIVGCIRYHFLGKFITSKNEAIYSVDCFCIHPQWRKKGVGDYLLTQLHIYVNKNKLPYSLFLKEGSQLNIINPKLYSGMYVYKKTESSNSTNSNNIHILTKTEAYSLMDIFREFNKNIFIIRNIKSNNQIWKLYRLETHKILVCFQDTFQRFYENNISKKIGWITAWIESPNISDYIREKASSELADSMFNQYDYIWMNKEWSGNSDKWSNDGLFHWYTYQWTTSIHIKKEYCILA